MKYPITKEFEFDHPSGRFTGFVEHQDEKLLKVTLTSKAACNLRIQEGAYSPGDTRYIKSTTPAILTGKTRMVAEIPGRS